MVHVPYPWPAHLIPSVRVLIPLASRGKVHRAELQLAQRVIDPSFKTASVFLITHFEPDLDELNACVGDVLFHLWTDSQESLVLLGRAEPHHMFHVGQVVAAAVKDDNFAGSRKVRQIVLDASIIANMTIHKNNFPAFSCFLVLSQQPADRVSRRPLRPDGFQTGAISTVIRHCSSRNDWGSDRKGNFA